ncbi:GRASP55/65 PDZ-like domain-containing protein [Gorgonomyces haynaldii]|nr:GRASP55/65 PDZ-like domain-containing protein [Gorgonomyces haynaldii]
MGQGQTQEVRGYHIIEIKQDSPAHKSGLQVYFDYITHINGQPFGAFNVKDLGSNPVELIVYSIKTLGFRQITLVPDGGLGLVLRQCEYQLAPNNIWHILEVQDNSPAQKAGLQDTDYIVGLKQGVLRDHRDFERMVKEYQEQPLSLFVYNIHTDAIREVLIVPSSKWGGSGLLGCDIGYGYAHRIVMGLEQHNKLPKRVPVHNHHDHSHEGHSHRYEEHHDHDHSHERHSHGHDHPHKHNDHGHDGHKHDEHEHHDHHDDHSHNEHCSHDHSHDGHGHSHDGHKHEEHKHHGNDHHDHSHDGHSNHDHSHEGHSHDGHKHDDHSKDEHSHDHSHDHKNDEQKHEGHSHDHS